MNLYIVDFKYYDTYEKKDMEDRWTLACKDDADVAKSMKLQFEQFERCGYKPINYSFQKITVTSNGYKVFVE